MSRNFNPIFQINSNITKYLLKIETAKVKANFLPLHPVVLSSLRESSRMNSTHYSTAIEGNKLSVKEVKEVVMEHKQIPKKERDTKEVQGYYAALNKLEQYVASGQFITEKIIQILHGLTMSENKPTPYRDGQNVIKDGLTGAVVYMPPEASDVSNMMKSLVEWIRTSDLPTPLVAAITHYQFATIHPYYDGNGRTARLITTLVLHLGGYDLHGIYSLEEYYAENLTAYYNSISIGPSHNYYLGRAAADITDWIEYFCKGMAESFEKVVEQMSKAEKAGLKDISYTLRTLDSQQKKALPLFAKHASVTNKQISAFLNINIRAGRTLCVKWIKSDFISFANSSTKAREYSLSENYNYLIPN